MKKTLKISGILVTILSISVGFCTKGVAQFTSRQQTEIINKTDSLITLYNTYGTFVEEVGYCSSNAARHYADLFEKEALLFDDLDAKNHQIKTGLFVKGYIEKAKSIFPNCLSKAEFTIAERGNPLGEKNNIFELTLTGEKLIMAYFNNTYYTYTFKNYQITIAFDKNLQNFHILRTSLKGLSITPPEKPIDVNFIVTGPDNKPMPNVSVLLKLDGVEFEKKLTDQAGNIRFKELPPEIRQVEIEAISLENPNMKYSELVSFKIFAKPGFNITLAEEKPVTLKIYLKDERSGVKLTNASVTLYWNGQESKMKTNEGGYCETEINSGTRNLTIWAHSLGYIDKTETKAYLPIDRQIKLTLKKECIPQYFRLSLAYGFILTDKGLPASGEFTDWQMSTKKWSGFNLGYELFPKSMKILILDAGLFGQLAFTHQTFDLSARTGYSTIENFRDPDQSIGTLHVSTPNLNETYSIYNLILSAGITLRYSLMPYLNLHTSICPSLYIVPSLTHTYSIGTSHFYGSYGNSYWGTTFEELERYGYEMVPIENMLVQDVIKSTGFGFTFQAGGEYVINNKIGLTFELVYSGMFSNMLTSSENNSLASIRYLDETDNPKKEYQYFGMLNTCDSFRWSNVGLQVGVRYTFKHP